MIQRSEEEQLLILKKRLDSLRLSQEHEANPYQKRLIGHSIEALESHIHTLDQGLRRSQIIRF